RVRRTVDVWGRRRGGERNPASARQVEARHAGGVVIIQVQAGNARVLCRRRSQAIRIDEHAITEEAEAEIGKPPRRDHVIEAVRKTLVAQVRGARERGRGEVRPAGLKSERAWHGLADLEETVAAEHVQLLRLIAVHAHVETVPVHDATSRGRVVRRRTGHTGDVRQRNELEQRLRTGIEHCSGYGPVRELLAIRRCRRAGCAAVQPSAGIPDRHAEIAQVAGTLVHGRYGGEQRTTVLLPCALIIAEEKGFVLLNRTADRAAELVPQRRRNESVRGPRQGPRLRERVTRRAVLIAAVFESAAVEIVAA